MEYCFEIRTSQDFAVVPGGYFAAALLANGSILPETEGWDEFTCPASLSFGRRAAGFGRRRIYRQADLPAGQAEAAPSRTFAAKGDIPSAFIIKTNVFLDPGLLARHLNLRIASDGAPPRDIPLSHPGVKIDWPCRGTFVIDTGAV